MKRIVVSVMLFLFLLVPALADSSTLDDPVVWLPMGELTDATGTYDAETNNGATVVAGLVGNAYDFEDSESDNILVKTSGLGLFNTTSWSLTFLLKPETVSGDDVVWSYDFTSWAAPYTSQHYRTTVDGVLKYVFGINNGAGTGVTMTDAVDSYGAGNWWHVVVTYENGNQTVWENGTLVDSYANAVDTAYYDQEVWIGRAEYGGYFDGIIDEVGFYNRTLSVDEIAEMQAALFSGNSYPFSTNSNTTYTVNVKDLYDDTQLNGANVTLSDGETCLTSLGGTCAIEYDGDQGTLTYNVTKTGYFTVTGSVGGNLTSYNNVTQARYNISSVTALVTGVSVTNFNVTVGSKTYADGVEIYLREGDMNLTWSKDGWYDKNFSITVSGAPTTGTSSVTGVYDVKYNVSSKNITGDLITNTTIMNMTYSSFTTNCSTISGWCLFNVTSGLEYTIISNPEGYAELNTTDNATAPTDSHTFIHGIERSFNISIYDEITEELLNTTFTIEIISSLSATNYTVTTGNLFVSLLTPDEYTIRYRAANYPERDYYETITPESSYDVSLYALTAGNATDTLVTIVDTTGDQLENATVQLLRYYVSCNCYRVVEMGKTSYNGLTYLVSEEVNGHYKFIVEYDSETEFLSTQPENFIADPTTGQIIRTITVDLGSNYYESFIAETELSSTATFNSATRYLSYIWNDPSSIVTTGCLRATYNSGARYKSLQNCSDGTSGSIILYLPNGTNYGWEAYVTTSTTYSDIITHNGFVNIDTVKDFGAVASFGSLFIIIGGAALFSFSAVAVLIFVAVVLISFVSLEVFAGIVILPFSMKLLTGFVALTVGISLYLFRK